ncbi:C-type lectin 37Da-like [Drosophila bipectinata]|uniref:C-type lectin 37Da-like n=1 Tax=Drosophila bipectinata TaxID=42026 RepID=UPI001C89B572|nr:C-type lectin 37Da-like [Drosophila bipectinata]
MFTLISKVVAFLGILSFVKAYSINPYIEEGIPENANITTDPFVKIGNGYYYIENSQTVNWYTAYHSCRKLGADLVTLENQEELKALQEYNLTSGFYWTSGSDLAFTGKHVWFSDAESISSDLWLPNEPNNADCNERCVLLSVANTLADSGLNDVTCSRNTSFICESPTPMTASFVIW